MTRHCPRFLLGLFLALALLAPILASAPTARAATCTVTTAKDDSTLLGSLRSRLQTPSCNTITFSSALNGKTIDLVEQLVIDHAVTINGPGSGNLTISGAKAASEGAPTRLLQISSGGGEYNVAISGLTLTGGSLAGASGNGAGVYIIGASVTLIGVVIRDNYTTSGGGGVHTEEGSVALINSTVSGNTAGFGGGLAVSKSTGILTNSIISGNSASSTGGGIDSYRANLNITNSTVSGNGVNADGGGISTNSTLNMTNSTISSPPPGHSSPAGRWTAPSRAGPRR